MPTIEIPIRKPRISRRIKPGRVLLFFPSAFLAVMASALVARVIPAWLAVLYLIVSGITFGVYAWDKWKAQEKKWPTPEFVLHILAGLGGWPGALIAQRTMRHKTQNLQFQIIFWSIVFAHFIFWLALVLRKAIP